MGFHSGSFVRNSPDFATHSISTSNDGNCPAAIRFFFSEFGPTMAAAPVSLAADAAQYKSCRFLLLSLRLIFRVVPYPLK